MICSEVLLCIIDIGLPLNEIITHYEPVTLLPLTISSTERNVNAQLHFTAHGRYKLSTISIAAIHIYNHSCRRSV